MNMARGMDFRRCFYCLLIACLSGCCCCHPDHRSCPSSAPPAPSTAPAASGSHYLLLIGAAPKPAPRALRPGDTVANVLARELSAPPGKPITIVLVRHAPEGKTRQLIPLDADGKLMDEKQDYVLRDGDELIFPGSPGTKPVPDAYQPIHSH